MFKGKYNEIDKIHGIVLRHILYTVGIDCPYIEGEAWQLWIYDFSQRIVTDLSRHGHPEHSHRNGRTVDLGFYLHCISNNTGYKGGKGPCKNYMDYPNDRMRPGGGNFNIEKNLYLWKLIGDYFPDATIWLDSRIVDEIEWQWNEKYNELRSGLIHRDAMRKYNHDTHIHCDLGKIIITDN